MGNGYRKDGKNVYFEARKKAAMYNDTLSSREGAARLLGISAATLTDYERGMVSRVVVNYTTNNIPMYDFVKDLEDDIADALEDDSDEDNIFYGIIKDSAIIMRDEFGNGSSITIETADDLTAMLVSVRLLSCEFVRREK